MILSDVDIIERIGSGSLEIEPYDEDNVGPASVDLRLGSDFKKAVTATAFEATDLDEGRDTIVWDDGCTDEVILHKGEFALATTQETVRIPDDLAGKVLGRSSLGRLGISIHQTAGYIDPGFEGEITLELSNHSPASVRLRPGQRVCQIVFEELSSPAMHPYGGDGSQYQGQSGATPSGMQFE